MTIKERRTFYATLLDKVDEQLKELKPKNPCSRLKRIISVNTEQYRNEVERLTRIRNRIEKSKLYWERQPTIGEAVEAYTGFTYISGCFWEDPIDRACKEVGLDANAEGDHKSLYKQEIVAAIFTLMETMKYAGIRDTLWEVSKEEIQERIEKLKIKLML